MMLILAIFTVLNIYNTRRLVKEKEPIRVTITSISLVIVSFIVGFLILINKRPSSPAEWIQRILQAIGVIK